MNTSNVRLVHTAHAMLVAGGGGAGSSKFVGMCPGTHVRSPVSRLFSTLVYVLLYLHPRTVLYITLQNEYLSKSGMRFAGAHPAMLVICAFRVT